MARELGPCSCRDVRGLVGCQEGCERFRALLLDVEGSGKVSLRDLAEFSLLSNMSHTGNLCMRGLSPNWSEGPYPFGPTIPVAELKLPANETYDRSKTVYHNPDPIPGLLLRNLIQVTIMGIYEQIIWFWTMVP